MDYHGRNPSKFPISSGYIISTTTTPTATTAPAPASTTSGFAGGSTGAPLALGAPLSSSSCAASGSVAAAAAGISGASLLPGPSRYENQKRRDWNTFSQYLRNHRPPLSLAACSGAHVLEFLRYLDQFGKTKVHNQACPFFGNPNPPSPCPCPLRQAWGSLDALVGRLRAAYEENGGRPETNPFGARAVRLFLREVRDYQAKARGVSYDKKRKKKTPSSSSNAPL